MALIFQRIETPGIAELSYLVGDDKTGTAAVIDPRPDVEIYIDLARQRNLCLTHIFETHIHADLVSGARELAARCQTAKVYSSREGGATYQFAHQPVADGDQFEFGETWITAHHTPGHTPEHMSYALAEKSRSRSPWGIFTGDSLFVNSAGRPDLLGKDADKLAAQLHDTFFKFFGKLSDGVIIYPSHGHGSPCGADIGDRLESTIGYEKRFNPYFQKTKKSDFVKMALSTAPPEPTYYQRMKKLNAEGPKVIGRLPLVPALPPKGFQKAVKRKKGIVLIDTRSMLAFGGGHIKGAINIGASPMLSIWAGWLIDPHDSILLVLDKDKDVDQVVPLFVRTGFTRFAGYLVGGMPAWDNAGLPLEQTVQMSVHELKDNLTAISVLDVRAPKEWASGHIPHAQHFFLPELEKSAKKLDPNKTVATYCDSGYRASIAASLLQRNGFKNVRNVPGSWQAWKAAHLPIEKGQP